jgi:hypothetical protein
MEFKLLISFEPGDNIVDFLSGKKKKTEDLLSYLCHLETTRLTGQFEPVGNLRDQTDSIYNCCPDRPSGSQ